MNRRRWCQKGAAFVVKLTRFLLMTSYSAALLLLPIASFGNDLLPLIVGSDAEAQADAFTAPLANANGEIVLLKLKETQPKNQLLLRFITKEKRVVDRFYSLNELSLRSISMPVAVGGDAYALAAISSDRSVHLVILRADGTVAAGNPLVRQSQFAGVAVVGPIVYIFGGTDTGAFIALFESLSQKITVQKDFGDLIAISSVQQVSENELVAYGWTATKANVSGRLIKLDKSLRDTLLQRELRCGVGFLVYSADKLWLPCPAFSVVGKYGTIVYSYDRDLQQIGSLPFVSVGVGSIAQHVFVRQDSSFLIAGVNSAAHAVLWSISSTGAILKVYEHFSIFTPLTADAFTALEHGNSVFFSAGNRLAAFGMFPPTRINVLHADK